jgi:hypothetical protein
MVHAAIIGTYGVSIGFAVSVLLLGFEVTRWHLFMWLVVGWLWVIAYFFAAANATMWRELYEELRYSWIEGQRW